MSDSRSLIEAMFYVLLYWFVVNMGTPAPANQLMILGVTTIAGFSLLRFALLVFNMDIKNKRKVLLQNHDYAFFGVVGLLAGIAFTSGQSNFILVLRVLSMFMAHVMLIFSFGKMAYYYHLIKPFQQKTKTRFYEVDLKGVEE